MCLKSSAACESFIINMRCIHIGLLLGGARKCAHSYCWMVVSKKENATEHNLQKKFVALFMIFCGLFCIWVCGTPLWIMWPKIWIFMVTFTNFMVYFYKLCGILYEFWGKKDGSRLRILWLTFTKFCVVLYIFCGSKYGLCDLLLWNFVAQNTNEILCILFGFFLPCCPCYLSWYYNMFMNNSFRFIIMIFNFVIPIHKKWVLIWKSLFFFSYLLNIDLKKTYK